MDIYESGVEETNETPESQSSGTAADQGNKRQRKKDTSNNLLNRLTTMNVEQLKDSTNGNA